MRLAGLIRLGPVFIRSLGRLPLGHLWYMLRHLRYEKGKVFAGRLHINAFFPPYPSEAFERFLSNVIARRRVPHSVYYAVTGRCVFSCPQCSYGGRPAAEPDTQMALAVIGQIKALGTATLGFTGGEPLLRRDLPELIAAAGPEMATVLFTTGWGLTAELAAKLKAAGLGTILISLESENADRHDELRGVAGSFAAALQAIELARAAGLYVGVSVVATREKLQSGSIPAIYALAESLNVQELRILEPIATGNYAACRCEQLNGVENQYLREFHQKMNRRSGGPAVCCFSQLEAPDMFGCGAGYHHLFIDAAGNVCPCDLTPLSMGNLTEKPLEEIWSQMGQYFARPRCNCLMKELPAMPGFELAGKTMPLPVCQSREMLEQIPPDSCLPGMYQRLGIRC